MNEHQTLEIIVERERGTKTLELQLSSRSCWASFLGAWPLPCAGAIDELDALLCGQDARRITLSGCPSSCLLPLVWMRSIWFPSNGTELTIDWATVDDPSDIRGQQPAGKLACILADHIQCADPKAAWRLWGIDVEDEIGASEEVFDLLTNIVDLWDTELLHMASAADWDESVRRALVRCASLGHRRVGIYGAGTHTRGVGDALMEPNVEVVCIIDDDARRHGQRMWGYEITSRERALELDLQAVVISANSIEDRLWESADVFRQRGITTLRLYGSNGEQEMLDTGQLPFTHSRTASKGEASCPQG